MIKRIGIECESIEGKNPAWGVGRIIMKLLEEISQRSELEKDFRFILYFKDQIPDFEFLNAPIFEKKTVPVPFFKNRLFPFYYFAFLPLKLWFERLDMMFWPNYMLPIIAFGRSTVMLTEDVYHETYEGKLPFRYRLAYWVFANWTAKFATKIMAISETSKRNLSKLYNIKPDRIFVNYLGIDFGSSFAKASEGLQQKEGEYLLFVGQAFPRRHLKETIEAYKLLTKESTDLKLIVIGPDKYPEPLDFTGVIHKDYVSDEELSSLYVGAKALVYVSDREAFGLPPMEALSFGVPPIIADNELGHELFGDYAFYSKSGNIDDITEAIKQALTDTDKISKIKSEGSEFVKKYNWTSFMDRFLDIITRNKNGYSRE